MKLIVGLGNPGGKYAKTRHNAGFMAVNAVGRHFGFVDARAKSDWKCRLAEGRIGGKKCLLLKPQTFMNLSGDAVQKVLHYYKLTPEDLIVIYDDFSIAPGTLRIRSDGSAAGHNGMRSVIGALGTDQFVRVRVGIAPFNAWQGSSEDYVLGQLTTQELEKLEEVLKKMPGVIETIVNEGREQAMNRYN